MPRPKARPSPSVPFGHLLRRTCTITSEGHLQAHPSQLFKTLSFRVSLKHSSQSAKLLLCLSHRPSTGLGNNMKLNHAVSGVLIASTLFTTTIAPAQELRGVWCSRFQWASETRSTAQSNVTTTLDNAVTGHFNCVFFQIRGQCDTLYPSPNEPWSPLISNPDGTSPGWDPLLYAVGQAHSRNLKIYGYFNLHTIWQGAVSPSSTAPSLTYYPNHIYYQHGNPNDAAHQDWLLFDGSGNPAAFNEYYWMNPGIPAADAYVRQQAAYVVSTYDLDGLHFDRVRMSGAGYGKNPLAVARWDDPETPTPNDGPGNPERLDWDEFMCDCVTRQVVNICGQCWGIKRWVLMSSSPLGLWKYDAYDEIDGYSSGFQYAWNRGQDAKAWMRMGAQDFIVPQIYWANGGTKPDFDEVFDDWQAAALEAGRYLVPGSNMSNGQTEVEAHALYARSHGAAGHNLWHSGSTEYATWSSAGHPYETTAAFPTFPWRDTEGVITGKVYLDACKTVPAVDAWITDSGTTWTALSSGDGFYSFLRVAPGTHTVTVSHPTLGTLTTTGVVVTAGQATNVDFAPAPVVPAAPTSLAAVSGESTISLTWNDMSVSESGFEVWRSNTHNGPYTLVTTATTNAVSYTDTLSVPGTYYYVVRAAACGIFSSYTNEASASVALPAGATNLVSSMTTGQTSVTLTWTDNATNEGSYKLYRGTTASGPFTLLATLPANSQAYVDDAVLYVTDISWQGSFYYYVAVSNALGNGPDTAIRQVELAQPPDVILESRTWSGGAPAAYAEGLSGGGSWANTAAKSLVTNPSVRAVGGRFTGTGSNGSYATFTPNILRAGRYEVLVTGPNPVIGLNVGSPGTTIDVRQGTTVLETRTYDNSRSNSTLADKWMSQSPPLIREFPLGSTLSIRLTNHNASSASTGQRFNVDAIRLHFAGYPSDVAEWEKY